MGILDRLYDALFENDRESDYSTYNERGSDPEERPRKSVSSGWAGLEEFVGGPIKIVNNYRQSEIQCFRAGFVYSGAQHSEYTPEGTYAISAYWSGDILYAQLSNNQICEWYNPGCPYLR